MTTKFAISAIDRRRFSQPRPPPLTAGVSMPKYRSHKVVKIGFLAPLTGAVAAWGKPGLDGCKIWADWVNEAGGIPIGGDTYKVEFVAYDDEYDPGKARTGAVKLIKEDNVQFVMMLGGDPWPGVSPVADKEKMLVSTLLPSDLTPETKMLVAPCEVHPIYNVTGVEWLAENKPDLKTAVSSPRTTPSANRPWRPIWQRSGGGDQSFGRPIASIRRRPTLPRSCRRC
jgi:branched-chain amino acid transport system substrate-binding protein